MLSHFCDISKKSKIAFLFVVSLLKYSLVKLGSNSASHKNSAHKINVAFPAFCSMQKGCKTDSLKRHWKLWIDKQFVSKIFIMPFIVSLKIQNIRTFDNQPFIYNKYIFKKPLKTFVVHIFNIFQPVSWLQQQLTFWVLIFKIFKISKWPVHKSQAPFWVVSTDSESFNLSL